MNYLAHAYLSFGYPEILVGNLISDFVKGKKKYSYPAGIQRGITLHREIDAFTDDHPLAREARKFFRPAYRLYSGAFVDVVFDHFLANDTRVFPGDSLAGFCQQVYHQVDPAEHLLPEGFRRMYPYMKKENWLYHYRSIRGIENSFAGLVHRAAYLQDSQPACDLLRQHYGELGALYGTFFPSLERYARQRLEELLSS
ncbi:MAG TPA: ACP phosphodiesterase [Chitinophagaceae bacterium]|nr:ACP phosphodiesterase [Chitinophagaceae bacterium]